MAKLGNIVAETLLRTQIFPSLATRVTYVAETNFSSRQQKMFLLQVKNIFVSRTQIVLPKRMLPSLATMEAFSSPEAAILLVCAGNRRPEGSRPLGTRMSLATRAEKRFSCFTQET